MSACSVHATWTLATEHVDVADRDRQFLDRVIPRVRALPGFSQGIWSRTSDGTRAYNTIVFDDRRGAEALLAQIEETKAQSRAAGVHLESLELMDVIASS